MGNLCGKLQDSDSPPRPGRVVGSPPLPAGRKTAPLPSALKSGRTLGGGSPSDQGHHPDEARRRAAEAAEARAKSSKGGKLQAQLHAQKKQTRNNILTEASAQESRSRDADQAAIARTWD